MEKIIINHDPERYENIFNMYQFDTDNNDNYVFYNILSKLILPSNLDDNIFEYYMVDSEMPLTTLSYKFYKTQHLWWLILLANNIKNPVKLIKSGSSIRVIKPEYLATIYDSIKQKI
jgi:hypothetical protein